MITFYVSPTGLDTAQGTTLETPFKTLQKAQEATRPFLGKKPITVYLREGTYVIEDTLTFTEQDRATESASITYRPYQDETVCLTGNHSPTSFTQETDQTENAIITLNNTQHLTFQNITIKSSQGHGIFIKDSSHNQIAGCTIHKTGKTGITVEGGTNHIIQSCNIYQTGETGITISCGNRQTLTRANHQIDNCHIHTTAQGKHPNTPAIKVSGVGIHISHNHIHNTPHNAILLTGNEHLIEYNHIHNVCLQTDDIGAIAMGGDWTERGIRIQYNHLHDLGGSSINAIGICLNNCASGAIILGNLFVRCSCAILIGGGRNHRVDNNIFAHCEPAIQIDGRGLDKSPVWHNLIYTTMKPRFESMNPLKPPYSIRYPELREVARYYQAEDGIPPEGNLILRNIVHQSTWTKIHWHATPKMVALQNNLTHEDPHFINAPQDDYRLQEDSPAHEIGIKPIPLNKIGPYTAPLRPTIT